MELTLNVTADVVMDDEAVSDLIEAMSLEQIAALRRLLADEARKRVAQMSNL